MAGEPFGQRNRLEHNVILISNHTKGSSNADVLRTKIAWTIASDMANEYGFQIYELLCHLIVSDMKTEHNEIMFRFDFAEANEIRNITDLEYRWNLDIDIIDEIRENLKPFSVDIDKYLIKLLPTNELCEEVLNVCYANN